MRREKIVLVSIFALVVILFLVFLVFGGHIISERRVLPRSEVLQEKQEAPGIVGQPGREVTSPEEENLRLKREREEREAALTKSERHPPGVPASPTEPVVEPRDTEEKPEGAEEGPAEEGEELTQEEYMKQLLEAARKYLNTLPVGSELPESVAAELSLNENQVLGVNEALKNEAQRVKQVVAEFYRANFPAGANEDLDTMDSSDILRRMLPRMLPDLQKMAKLSVKEQLQVAKGERSVLEWIPRDAFTARLAYELYKGRQKTYEELALYLDEGSVKKLTGKYLLPNTFVFPGRFNLNFGEVNWEQE